MDIGIGLPATIPGTKGSLVLDWAKRADSASFSSLGVLDRMVYPNYEPLIALAAAAAVTSRVRLMTTVLLAPLRGAGVLAKQAASIDALSEGRLTLGLGVGGREDDFRVAPASFRDRARRFEEQLDIMKRIWSGQPVSEEMGPVGPPPAREGGPELLIGGYSPTPIRRVGRWADGFISGGVPDPEQVRQMFDLAEESWRAEGRKGKPRLVASLYYVLGPNAARGGRLHPRLLLLLRAGRRRHGEVHPFLPGARRGAYPWLWRSRCGRGDLLAYGSGARSGRPPR
jgi:alkanesulfonate monooxygenase SsuD/methylene tetrahydromethanopterin reductase-like flavin-dependent oxidoreductase (luciferase family)